MDVKLLIWAWAFLCLGGFVVPQHPDTDFAVVFMHNVLHGGGKPHLELLLTSYFPNTKANIRLPRLYFIRVLNLSPGIPTTVVIPKKVELLSSARSNMTVRITSNKPISVVAINKRAHSTGVAVVSPVSEWGSEYYLMTPDSNLEGSLGQVAVVNGPKPNLISLLLMGLVQFENTPYFPGEQLNLTLGPWESVQLQTNQSLTASKLVSREDVAVFVGLCCADVHGLCSHIYLQLPATSAWGSTFVVPPLPSQSLSKVNILAASDTLVRLIHGNDTTDIMVVPGMRKEFEVDPTTSIIIRSVDKIMVLYLASGVLYNIPPTEKACVSYAIISLPGFKNNLLLAVPEDSWEGLELDHKPLPESQWERINMTDLVYTILPLKDGKGYHFISNANVNFGLVTVGMANSTLYALPGICLDKEYLLCGFEYTNSPGDALGNMSSCVSLAPPTCMAWGNTYLWTFYESLMPGSEICPRVLISSQGDALSLLPFSVERESRSGFIIQIRVFGLLLEIYNEQPGVVFISDEKMYTPVSLLDGRLNVTRFGFLATIVNVSFGLRVLIGDHGFLHLQIARRYYESLSGDCAAQSSREMLNSTRSIFPDLILACDPVTVEDLKLCDNSSATADYSNCQIMSESEVFQSCHLSLDPKPFIESCESEVCNGGSSCSSIEAYALACGIDGAHLIGWRNLSRCDLQCPDHSYYESCSANCSASCSETEISNCDTSLCYEACLCDDGYELSAGSCVPKEECGCYWQGSYYLKGGEFLGKDCKTRCRCPGSTMECHQIEGCGVGDTCTLNSGSWSCQPMQNRSCTLYGDSHYIAFDGQAYNFNGFCESRMAGVCSNYPGLEAFEVHIIQDLILGTRIKAVNITVYGKTITLDPSYNGKVNVDGALVHTPYVVDASLQIYKSNLGAEILQTDFGLVVSFDKMKRLLIKVPAFYMASVCGLCSSMINLDSRKPSCGQYCQGICTKCTNELYLAEATTTCGLINDPQGAFRDCHQKVDPNPYFEACVNNMCSGFLLCPTLYAYAAACQEACAEVYPWRRSTDCGYECPPNSTYTCSRRCASSCLPTCDITLPLTCAIECQEGCQCDPGYILSGDGCVLPEDCGCYVEGQYWKRGDIFYDDKCQYRCSCLDGGIVCESHNCTSEEQCATVMGVRACYPSYLTCMVSGQSYLTFDGLSYQVNKNCPFAMALVTNTEEVVNFQVHLKSEILNEELESVQKAILKVYGYTIVLNLYRDVLEVDGNLTHFPVYLDHQVFGYENDSHILLETDFGLQLFFDPTMVSLIIPIAYAGRIHGLCGNANGIVSDDSPELPYTNYILSNETSDDSYCNIPDFYAPKYCELIMEAEGPFKECHGILNPQDFYNHCLSTVNEDYVHSICQSIQYYDNECQWAGATVYPWKNETFCQSTRPPAANLSLTTLSMPLTTEDEGCFLNVFPSSCLSLTRTCCLFQHTRSFAWLDELEDHSSPIDCSLLLAEVCSNEDTLVYFSVSLNYEVLGNQSMQTLHIEIYGLKIFLPWNWKNGVWVNKVQVSLPTCLIPSRLQIRVEGTDLILEALFGLRIKYDPSGLILIQLPFGYQSNICGQCAQTPETRLNFTSEISRNDSESQCLITVTKEKWNYNEDSLSSNSCKMFLGDDSPFSDCHQILNPDSFYDSCQSEVCQERESGGTGDLAACRDLEEYATLCQSQYGVIKPWRNESFCPFTCSPSGTYELCTRTCIQCQNGTCSGPCQEGCNCTEGHLWNGANCVPSNTCTKTTNPDEPKRVICETPLSQSDCRFCKLSHQQIVTFGNISSPLELNGAYDILKKCDSSAPEWLRVVLHLQPPQPAKLHVFYENNFITINSTLDVWVNGGIEELPIMLTPELFVVKEADTVALGQTRRIAILFSSAGDLKIEVLESLSTELCGACAFGNLLQNNSPSFSLESWRADDLVC